MIDQHPAQRRAERRGDDLDLGISNSIPREGDCDAIPRPGSEYARIHECFDSMLTWAEPADFEVTLLVCGPSTYGLAVAGDEDRCVRNRAGRRFHLAPDHSALCGAASDAEEYEERAAHLIT